MSATEYNGRKSNIPILIIKQNTIAGKNMLHSWCFRNAECMINCLFCTRQSWFDLLQLHNILGILTSGVNQWIHIYATWLIHKINTWINLNCIRLFINSHCKPGLNFLDGASQNDRHQSFGVCHFIFGACQNIVSSVWLYCGQWILHVPIILGLASKVNSPK
jgi:hypothetical protein